MPERVRFTVDGQPAVALLLGTGHDQPPTGRPQARPGVQHQDGQPGNQRGEAEAEPAGLGHFAQHAGAVTDGKRQSGQYSLHGEMTWQQ